MKLLLDTCTFMWVVWDPGRLSQKARDIFQDKANASYLSLVSVWEMTIKYQLGKMPFKNSPAEWLEEACNRHFINLLFPSLRDVYALVQLPLLHGDPFDRLLVARALAGGFSLLTNDADIRAYDARVLW